MHCVDSPNRNAQIVSLIAVNMAPRNSKQSSPNKGHQSTAGRMNRQGTTRGKANRTDPAIMLMN